MTRRVEKDMALAMLGRRRASVLMSDAYKFAMAQAGAPLRRESFYLSFRRPGRYLQPFDLEALVRALVPRRPRPEELAFLRRHGFGLTPAMLAALEGELRIWSAPRGSWLREGEPLLRVEGPSFLVSWLESMVIWLQYPIQVATAARLDGRRYYRCSCEDEARISELALLASDCGGTWTITVDADRYRQDVRRRGALLAQAVGGQVERLFELGMRGVTCMGMHRMALEELSLLGFRHSSNPYLSKELELIPVGTTGHEHQQRWGSDLAAFEAVRDMRSQTPSYLFDTYDAMALGIPAAIKVMRDEPSRRASVRFDSGDYLRQLRAFAEAGVEPTFIFMDSMNPERISELESACESMGIPRGRRLYGAGGYLVKSPLTSLGRDRVAAVYKLCESGGRPLMKFSVRGKRSMPGKPVVFRRVLGSGPWGLIGQEGERPPAGYQRLKPGLALAEEGAVEPSPASAVLISMLEAEHLPSREPKRKGESL